VGGTGRGDTAPYSDVDLLFLRSKKAGSDVQDLINALVRNLWDYGMKLSQSVRTPQDAIEFRPPGPADAHVADEARLLVGSRPSSPTSSAATHRLIASTSITKFIEQVVRERGKEHRTTSPP
jgi:[protein-PII] uridylyltransferase